MAESQLHGFVWEKSIRTEVFGLSPTAASYTAVHDIAKEENKFDSTENISVKCTGIASVCMGCPRRIFAYDPADRHTAIIVQYSQQDTTKHVERILELSLDDKQALFGDVTLEDIEALEALIKSVPAGPVPAESKERIHALKADLNRKSGLLHFNPKLDSKNQRRLQCSIPRADRIPTALVRAESSDGTVRGVSIPRDIVSSRRIRNARV